MTAERTPRLSPSGILLAATAAPVVTMNLAAGPAPIAPCSSSVDNYVRPVALNTDFTTQGSWAADWTVLANGELRYDGATAVSVLAIASVSWEVPTAGETGYSGLAIAKNGDILGAGARDAPALLAGAQWFQSPVAFGSKSLPSVTTTRPVTLVTGDTIGVVYFDSVAGVDLTLVTLALTIWSL